MLLTDNNVMKYRVQFKHAGTISAYLENVDKVLFMETTGDLIIYTNDGEIHVLPRIELRYVRIIPQENSNA